MCYRRKLLLGPPGEDQIIPVPVGVTVTTDEGRIIGILNIYIEYGCDINYIKVGICCFLHFIFMPPKGGI